MNFWYKQLRIGIHKSARLSGQSSELGPHPLSRMRVLIPKPLWVQGGDTLVWWGQHEVEGVLGRKKIGGCKWTSKEKNEVILPLSSSPLLSQHSKELPPHLNFSYAPPPLVYRRNYCYRRIYLYCN